jgi:hypothetical protein
MNQERVKGLRLLIAFRVVFARRIHRREFAAAGPREPRLQEELAKASSENYSMCGSFFTEYFQRGEVIRPRVNIRKIRRENLRR